MPGRENEELTAAECAARTGLTVRALRVYEEYGLIAPRRSASGWRYYDAADLVRLNTIGLLKTAGLSLVQIRQVTILNERAPPLQHVLEMQIETWKEQRCRAERGQAIAETALQKLKANQSLAVDELCNLVRSLEMSDQNPESPEAQGAGPAIKVDPAILDGYCGTYRISEYTLLTVTLRDDTLVGQMGGWPPSELAALSEREFISRFSGARFTFPTGQEAAAPSVTISSKGPDLVAKRIDAATADGIRAGLAARISSNSPVPGSEAALRRLIDGMRNGTVDYSEMTSTFAATVRAQLPQLLMIARYLGAITSIEFKGVGNQGWDSYEVRRENGVALWRIAYSDGLITGAMASFADGP
jgi:DNA-binding transcriptional MerR regulator